MVQINKNWIICIKENHLLLEKPSNGGISGVEGSRYFNKAQAVEKHCIDVNIL